MLERSLVVFFPEWPVLAHGYRSDELVAIVHAQHVIAASTGAARTGVRKGQRVKDAQALARGLGLVEADFSEEARAFVPVLKAMQELTPTVRHAPGWASFPTRGPARYFGGELALRQLINERLIMLFPAQVRDVQELPWRIGIADGVFGAVQAAKLEAIWDRGETPRRLARFPIEILGSTELAQSLRHLGIISIEDFASLQEGDVLARFGKSGAHAHRLARGLEDEPMLVPRPEAEYLVEIRLDEPAESIESASFLVKSLAETLRDRLESSGLSCSLLEVSIEMTDGTELRERWSENGVMVPSIIAERVRFQLEAFVAQRALAAHDMAMIESIALCAIEVAPARARPIPLWGATGQDDVRVQKVIARLQGMLGGDAVMFPVRTGGRGPAEQVRLVSQAASEADRLVDAPWPGRLPAPNPARILSEASEAVLCDKDGEPVLVDGRGNLSASPAWVYLQGESKVEVLGFAGPWPVEERWWDRRHARRRARLQVLTESQRALLLAQEKGHWKLEAIYD